MKGLPLYLFYNAAFVPEWEFDLTEDNDQQNNIEEFGCSLITAAYIKKMCYNKRKSRTGGLA